MTETTNTTRLILSAIVAAKLIDAARSPLGSTLLRAVFGVEV